MQGRTWQRRTSVRFEISSPPVSPSLDVNHHHTSMPRRCLAEVRSRYWINKGRQTVKAVLFRCSVCRNVQGKHYLVPDSPDLPAFRVCEEHSFNVRVDFTGPICRASWQRRTGIDQNLCGAFYMCQKQSSPFGTCPKSGSRNTSEIC